MKEKQKWTAKESIGFMLVLGMLGGLCGFVGFLFGVTARDNLYLEMKEKKE